MEIQIKNGDTGYTADKMVTEWPYPMRLTHGGALPPQGGRHQGVSSFYKQWESSKMWGFNWEYHGNIWGCNENKITMGKLILQLGLNF